MNQFASLDLSEYTSLTSIESFAFAGNQLKTSKIPLSLTTLADDAFRSNPGSNAKKQVYLFTPDYTNPNNLKDTEFHLINPITGPDDVTLYTFSGTTITGLSERGKKYFEAHHDMVLPGKNPQGELITAIGENSFCNNWRGYGLKSVDFSNCTNLTSIGKAAFAKNQLTSLNLSSCTNLVSISNAAFTYNELTNLDLSKCTNLTSIGNEAFYHNQLTTLELSKCKSLTSIGYNAFGSNELASLDLSVCTSLTSIGDYTFGSNQLKTAKIPLSLKTLADTAFESNPGNNDKSQVYLFTPDYTNPNNLKDTDYHLINPVESSDDVTLYTFNGTTITGLSERGKKYFETHHDMKLPGKNPQGQAVTAIGKQAFFNTASGYGLISVDFSNCTSLKSIDDWAFRSNQLTSLDLSTCKNLTDIGDAAFYENQLTNINLSGCTSLTSIDYNAFNSNKLTSLDLSGCTSLTDIGDAAFRYNQLTSLNLSECTSLKSIGVSTFNENQLANLDLSGCTSLTNINNFAFDSNKLKTAKIPLSLTTLADNAFGYNPGNNDKKQVYLYTPDYTNPNNLKDTNYHLINPITGPDDVTLYTFDGTTITGLSDRGKKYFAENHEMVLPAKTPDGQDITEVGVEAFDNNGNGYGLTSVDFSNCTNLTSISRDAFSNNQLTSLDLSKCIKLTRIGFCAFADNKLKTAKIPLSLAILSYDTFKGNLGSNAKKQVYLYTSRKNNPQNLPNAEYHIIDPITFIIKKVDTNGNPIEGVEFSVYYGTYENASKTTNSIETKNGPLELNKINTDGLMISSERLDIIRVMDCGGGSGGIVDLNDKYNPKPGDIVITAKTNKQGTAEITIPYGPYYLVEDKTVPGYSVNKKVTIIDETTNGKIITYTDYEVSIEIPETGTLGIIPYILLALILVSGAYVVLRKKKEEK